jgi:hypothetical protein
MTPSYSVITPTARVIIPTARIMTKGQIVKMIFQTGREIDLRMEAIKND